MTTLDLSVAREERNAPEWKAPDLAVIQELGARHEAEYLKFLRETGVSVVELQALKDEQQSIRETISCMEKGVEAIAQGSLLAGRWFGRPDILRKVSGSSRFGDWAYEIYDCKLSRETKAHYNSAAFALFGFAARDAGRATRIDVRGAAGKIFCSENYRFAEYAAYYRWVRDRWRKLAITGREKILIRSRVSIATCAVGSASAITDGGPTITFPSLRVSGGSSEHNWWPGTPARLRG